MAAPKFTDIRAAVEPGIQTFKNIQALRQKEIEEDKKQKEREDAIKENLYANLPGLQSDIVPDNFKKDATELALNIRNEQKRLIQNKENMDQYEFIDQMRLLNDKVSNINKDFQAYKEWSANWVDLKETDDLSSAMSAKQRKTIVDIVTGQAKPVKTEEGLGYEVDGEIHLLKNLPKPIEIEYKLHNQMETDMLNLGAKFGAQGRGADDELYKKQKQLALTNLRRGLTREKALSLASDFLKIGGDQGEQAGILQEFIDNPNTYTYMDPEEGKMQGLDAFKEYIVDQYAAIADSTVNSEKAIYDKNKELQAAQKGGFKNKWEYDTWLEGQEKRANAIYIKPLQNFLPSTPINEQQTSELLSYANNNIPNIEIYQNPNEDKDGKLINPNNYIIEVNGKQKFFDINKTPGTTVFKYIQDLYGYNAMERANYFNIDTGKNESQKDEFSEYKEEPVSYSIEQKTIDEIISGTYDRKKALEEKISEEKNKELINTLRKNFESGRITKEYLSGPGKPIYDNWVKTKGEIDLSLRSS